MSWTCFGRIRWFIASLVLIGTISAAGCNSSHPGNWDEPTVETKLREKMELESLDLSPSPEGFTGSGKDSKGQTYSLTVTQDAAAKRISYVAEGDRGNIEEGFIEFN